MPPALNDQPPAANCKQAMKRIIMIIGFILLLLAGLSVAQGIANALKHSQDFQWSPAKLFWSRQNPYAIYLEGNLRREVILFQIPNYAQLLYVLFAPFALLSFQAAKIIWALTNIAFAISASLLACKLFRLSSLRSFFITCLFLIAMPTRNTVGNGQHSLLILVAFIGSLYLSEWNDKASNAHTFRLPKTKLYSALLAGITYTKYSFAPSLGTAFLRRNGLAYFAVSFAPVILGYLFFAFWSSSEAFSPHFFTQPFRVASQTVAPGAADLLSIINLYVPAGGAFAFLAKAICLALAGSAPFWIRAKSDSLEWWSFCSIASLTFVNHLSYDYVFYLLPAMLAIKNLPNRFGIILAALVIYPWYGSRILFSLDTPLAATVWIGFIVNLLVLSALILHANRMRLSPPCA